MSAILVRLPHSVTGGIGVDPFRPQPFHLRAAFVEFGDRRAVLGSRAVGKRLLLIGFSCLLPPLWGVPLLACSCSDVDIFGRTIL